MLFAFLQALDVEEDADDLVVGNLDEITSDQFHLDWGAVREDCGFAGINPVASDGADEADGTRGLVCLPPPK